MNIAIVGFAGQGKSSFEYWKAQGHDITICDRNEGLEVPAGASARLGEAYLQNLNAFDVIVRTPIIHPRDIVTANPDAPEILAKVTSNTNEFFTVCPTKNIIGVTGTKGKGTTSTLITKMLEAGGKRVHLGGNIGTPPLELLKNDIKPDDWVVLELANFQLIDLKHSPHIGVVLMVEPEHLDWHEDLEEYIAAKQQMFINQTEEDVAIYYAANEISVSVADASMGEQIPYLQSPGAHIENEYVVIDGKQICSTKQIRLPGKHNWQNACAATTAAWQVLHEVGPLQKALTSFSGLPFRIELRREVDGVKYYDDSFATGAGATIAAIEAIPEKKVLILGGHDRGLNLEKLADVIKKHDHDIQKVILVGASAQRMSEVLEQKGFFNYVHESSRNMDAIVRRAREFARQGDAVLLSPAFASFDMFKNFEDRGIQFNAAVDAL